MPILADDLRRVSQRNWHHFLDWLPFQEFRKCAPTQLWGSPGGSALGALGGRPRPAHRARSSERLVACERPLACHVRGSCRPQTLARSGAARRPWLRRPPQQARGLLRGAHPHISLELGSQSSGSDHASCFFCWLRLQRWSRLRRGPSGFDPRVGRNRALTSVGGVPSLIEHAPRWVAPGQTAVEAAPRVVQALAIWAQPPRTWPKPPPPSAQASPSFAPSRTNLGPSRAKRRRSRAE